MEDIYPNSLEKALAKTEADIAATLKAAISVVSSLKKSRTAAQTGSLRELKKTIESAEIAIAALKQQYINTKEGWAFESESYFASGSYSGELLDMSKSLGVKIFEQDDRLYCYPYLLRILSGELAVQIDKAKEKRTRPSILVNLLKELQSKPVKFKSEEFLESLFSAYEHLVKERGDNKAGYDIVITLLEMYKMFTLLPGQSKEYSQLEFARDVYLLDRSGLTKTKIGYVIKFPASTGSKTSKNVISVITQDGQAKKYYGISFSKD